MGGSILKKPKSLETKLRSAIRLIWSRSAERRSILKQASYQGTAWIHSTPDTKGQYFQCPLCDREWPIQMAEVDHEPPLGIFDDWHKVEDYINRMFFGPQRAICKLCHKKKTSSQRKKRKLNHGQP